MNQKTHILALDQGTSSSRSIVFDARGQIVAMAQREFRQIYPQPGWVEHDPAELWSSQLATAQEALAKAIMAHSREVWVAADHSKFNRPAMVELGRLDQVDTLFTDRPPPAPFPALLAEAGVNLVTCSQTSP